MKLKHNKLYCTFVQVDQIKRVLELLQDKVQNKIFILGIEKGHEQVLTYNLVGKLPEELLDSTVLCHRHRLTRTLYTINALNNIIQQKTGTKDKNYKINWDNYKDSLLVVQDQELIQFKTKLINII